ncbi:TrbC family F-type conjugative pilus assembly protein [Vibrio coralliilyticus]|uniref:TrbC family F-type conjugative pilus assembly protein n=1 Tax=Vibrio coralliilyticus TaxID=190893 RepID=UPI00211C3F4A|nr:TrbC family F-type conjugative pilus assembly protein [Vibrio coralliilyticus]
MAGAIADTRALTSRLYRHSTTPNGLLNAKGALPIRAGVAIDPDAFHRFHVRDVPTFVLIKSNRCQARWPCGPDDHAKIKGNVSIRTALEALSTSPLADVAETLLEAQRDDH